MATTLFTRLRVGNMTLSHRIVMAPLTRFRANDNAVHEEVAAEYYEQRANPGGLIIGEATYISEEAGGQKNAPGLWNTAQVASWKRIVDKVHAKGGFIVAQLRADGRAADPQYLRSKGHTFVAPSDVPIVPGGEKPTPLSRQTIDRFIQTYAQAARNAVEAGFDGVEVHNANGYLPDQFLDSNANRRTDEYGGSAENRARFTLSVVEAMTQAIGQERVAIRFSPFNEFQGMRMPEPDLTSTFSYVTAQLRDRFPRLAWIHFVEPRVSGDSDVDGTVKESLDFLRKIWNAKGERPFFAAGGYTSELAMKVVAQHGGAVVFGRSFISNPDLPLRLKNGIPLTRYDRSTFYTPGPEAVKGYIDYPTAAELASVF